MYRLQNSVCLSAIYLSLSRQRHDILDFSCCSQPRVLHVTLTNSTFGFELHMRSIPCPFSRQLAIVLIVLFFFFFAAKTCWRDSTRSKQLTTSTIRGFQFKLHRQIAFIRRASSLFSNQPCFLFISYSVVYEICK